MREAAGRDPEPTAAVIDSRDVAVPGVYLDGLTALADTEFGDPVRRLGAVVPADAYGTPVSHLQVSLEVRAGFHHALGSRPALSGTRLHELVDALA
ncbi:hypothetical protein, partial [Streptomyces sp. AS58]|uniref:hypothetical protein n=1 Tax=Streptomyces sp. AS58 TaxID=1519489 RepID=UPI000B1838CC